MQNKAQRSQTYDAFQQNQQYYQGLNLLQQPINSECKYVEIYKRKNNKCQVEVSQIMNQNNFQNLSDAEIQYPNTGKQYLKKSIKYPKVQLPIIQNEIKQYYQLGVNGSISECESKTPNIQFGHLNLEQQKPKKVSQAGLQQKSLCMHIRDENLFLQAFSEDEINCQSKNRNKRLMNIVKDLNKALSISPNVLSIQQTKNQVKFKEENENQPKLKLSEIIKRNIQKLDIAKIVKEKILEKRIENFQQLYGITNKYEEEEDIFSKKYTTNEANKAEDLRRRKKLILEVAQRKSPKFIYPLGPKIRVPNISLENQYFLNNNIGTSKKYMLYSHSKSKQEDDTNIYKLDSPPKNQLYPTSSMEEDYLDIKVQQIVRQL